ncbi:hypothetical protein BGX29_010559, partial [Mortierella sp. GBA35]
GYVSAQLNIGILYEDGRGVPQDYSQAMDWYSKAADQGDAVAQYCVGNLFYHGLGVPQDYSQAMEWCRKAADQGNTSARERCYELELKGYSPSLIK